MRGLGAWEVRLVEECLEVGGKAIQRSAYWCTWWVQESPEVSWVLLEQAWEGGSGPAGSVTTDPPECMAVREGCWVGSTVNACLGPHWTLGSAAGIVEPAREVTLVLVWVIAAGLTGQAKVFTRLK